ncbi:MAG TPA: PEGA domain-containing protein [Polyangiaceae bacterium]|nr:PEGA domain-containing protein [Polyangiaceae bacterium]
MAAILTAPSQWPVLVAALALFTPVPVRAQTTVAPAEASRHFDRGYLLAQQGSLEGAIEEFKLAYALQPHASVLYNLGQAYAASGRAVEAIDALERFLAETPASDTQRRSHAASLIEYQGQRVGSLTLSVSPPGAQISLDGVALEPKAAAAPIRLTAGWHSLSITLEGYEPRTEGLQVVGKVSSSLSLVLSKKHAAQVPGDAPSPPPAELGRLREAQQRRISVQRTSALLVGGVGLASLATAGILFASNQRGYADWRRDSQRFADDLGASGMATPAELDRLLERENTLRNRDAWALGLAVIGGAMSVGSAVLWLSSPQTEESGLSLQLLPAPRLGYSGRF